jgi:hypothetical protein
VPGGEGAHARSSIPRLQSQIDAIHAGRTSSLDLSDSALGERLTEVPDEIRGLEGLRTLVVGYSAIDRLPSWIGDLPHIEEIDTSHHPIAALPYRPNIRWSIHAETLILCSDALDPAQVYAISIRPETSSQAVRADPRNYIPAEEFFTTCRSNGFTDRSDMRQLGGYLHDLGICLFFQDDPLLSKTVILKPEWGTGAVYRVLDDPGITRSLGVFRRDDLQRIWSDDPGRRPACTARHDRSRADAHPPLLSGHQGRKVHAVQLPEVLYLGRAKHVHGQRAAGFRPLR